MSSFLVSLFLVRSAAPCNAESICRLPRVPRGLPSVLYPLSLFTHIRYVCGQTARKESRYHELFE